MERLKIYKSLAGLPATLDSNAIYAVRVGMGFDLYFTNAAGTIAHKLNVDEPEALNDLTDADTTGVIPEDGWIVKYVNGVLVPCFRKLIISSDLRIVNFGTGNMLPKFSVDFNIQRTGLYSFDLKTAGSTNSTTSDLVGTLLLDNTPLATIANGHIFRIEQKDASGDDLDGRLTNQKSNLGNRLFSNITTLGVHTLTMVFSGSAIDLAASLFDTSCVIEEEFGVVNNNLQ